MNFVSVETRIIDCDFCGDETDDPFEVDEMLVCGYCDGAQQIVYANRVRHH